MKVGYLVVKVQLFILFTRRTA